MTIARLEAPTLTAREGEFSRRSLTEIEAWLERLPRASGETCARELGTALRSINHAPLHKAERHAVMERFRPVVNDTITLLVGRYRNHALPLTPAGRAQAGAVQQLLAEVAGGYKQVVNEIEARGRGRRRKAPVLRQAVQRALLVTGRRLFECYRVYAPEPEGLWRELHALYRYAEQLGVQSQPIEATPEDEETALSIRQAYLRTVLLALANPYHLMQGEAEALYRRLGRWVHLARLEPVDEPHQLAGKFGIDLGSDFPPRYYPSGLRLPPPNTPRALVLGGVVEALQGQVAQCNDHLRSTTHVVTLSTRLQRDMYVRIHEAYGARRERTAERQPTVARLGIAEGLSACHFFLNGQRPFDPETSEREWQRRHRAAEGHAPEPALSLMAEGAAAPTRTGREARFKAFDAEWDDVWNRAERVEVAANRREATHEGPIHQVGVWHRKNESEGGIALFCGARCPMSVRVGELVAYSAVIDPQAEDWGLGCIRWLRTRQDGGLEFGIKRLADDGHAVGVKAVHGPGRGTDYLRSILLPRCNPLLDHQRIPSLLTPAGVYDVGTVLRLTLADMVLHVRLTALLEASTRFAHFRFRLIEPPTSRLE